VVKLITNIEEISSMINVDVKKNFTSVLVGFDSYKALAPKIIEYDNKKYLLACHLEKGNIIAQKKISKTFPDDIEIIYYSPFFSFETSKEYIYPDLMSAFKKIVKQEKLVVVQNNIPVSIYRLLLDEYNIKFDKEEKISVIYNMYILSKNDVLKQFNSNRDEAAIIASELIKKSPIKSYLKKMISKRSDTRFENLDKLMQKNKVNAVMCTSPLGIQEITGYGLKKFRENQQISALYKKGEDKIYVFSKLPIDRELGNSKKVDIFSELSDKLSINDVLGIEEDHLPANFLANLEISIGKTKNCMNLIRKSRQNRGWEDLSFHIIVTRATVYAIEKTLQWTKNRIKNKERISELDVENNYKNRLNEFKNKYNLPFNIVPMLTICCSGNRTVIPSLPTEYYLDSYTKSLKIDACVSIIDDQGIHHAASDIARTLVLEKEIKTVYEKLDDLMVRSVIPNIKPGMKGKDIYNLAVSKIDDNIDCFKNTGLLPLKVKKFDEIFNRNVGHIMGLQEPVTLFFLKDASEKVELGMIATIEYQWHTKDYGIGIEDDFIIGTDMGLNFSRDQL